MAVRSSQGARRGPYRGKRLFDLAVVAVVALPAAVVGLVCAIAIVVTSGLPVLSRQQRVGWPGRPLTILKLRTMVHRPEGNPIFPEPSRITAVGRVLRRLSLDELPQLLNVARGEMSIVGPRPPLPYQYARYDGRQRRRHEVRPGLTGLAQVNGRNAILWADRIEHDLAYLDSQSPMLDLRILLRTLGAILRGAAVQGHPHDDPLARPAE